MSGNYRNKNHRGGGGGNFRGKRNSRGRGGGRRDKDDNKGQWQTSSRLSEPEAGISQFISNPELKFHGIIKSR